jgi:hypothetical protein
MDVDFHAIDSGQQDNISYRLYISNDDFIIEPTVFNLFGKDNVFDRIMFGKKKLYIISLFSSAGS